MKRIKTLIAGILGTVANLAWTIMYGYTLIVLIALLGGATGATGAAGGIVIFTNAIIFLSALLGLIFSILSLVYFNSSAEVFEKKKKFNVTAIVFNFISAFFFLLTFFGEGVNQRGLWRGSNCRNDSRGSNRNCCICCCKCALYLRYEERKDSNCCKTRSCRSAKSWRS